MMVRDTRFLPLTFWFYSKKFVECRIDEYLFEFFFTYVYFFETNEQSLLTGIMMNEESFREKKKKNTNFRRETLDLFKFHSILRLIVTTYFSGVLNLKPARAKSS